MSIYFNHFGTTSIAATALVSNHQEKTHYTFSHVALFTQAKCVDTESV
jgi:hypothetical protein